MGTRGIVGFRLHGQDKLIYNHFDSYPDGLGAEVVRALPKLLKNPEQLTRWVEELQPVPKDKPTPEQIKKLKKFTDLGVSEQSTNDWYCLLRKTQGDLAAILESGFYSDSRDFAHDSLFCEYGYIINLDENVLEFYVGFQTKPHNRGRYAAPVSESVERRKKIEDMPQYQGIALVGTFPFPKNVKEGGAVLARLMKVDQEESERKDAA